MELSVNCQRKWHSFGAKINGHFGSSEKLSSASRINILMVEQNIAEASELADRIYLMEDGRIIFEGSKEEALSSKHVKEVFLGM